MRISVRKHYKKLAEFVDLANLAWEAMTSRAGEFPDFAELDPDGKHSELLERIDRRVQREFPNIKPLADVPPLFLPTWRRYGRSWWRQLHAYALVRRVFDSLMFLADAPPLVGAQPAVSLLQIAPAADGSMVRVRDPFEDFLAALAECDLRRLGCCPVCRRLFIAYRIDQKACSRLCANQNRVTKFRKKQSEYEQNRKFRKRTGLAAIRRGRSKLVRLNKALRDSEE